MLFVLRAELSREVVKVGGEGVLQGEGSGWNLGGHYMCRRAMKDTDKGKSKRTVQDGALICLSGRRKE